MAFTPQSVSSTLTGGNIVSIIGREAARFGILRAISPFGHIPEKMNPLTSLATVPITVKKQEAYTYQAEVTEHAVESGAIMSDHVIIRPLKIDISFEVSNWEEGFAQSAQGWLEDLFRSRVPVELETEYKIIPNMVLTSLSIDNSAPIWRRLSCRASFTQIQLVTVQTAKYPESNVKPTEKTGGPDASKSAADTSDKGNVKPKSRLKAAADSFSWDSAFSSIFGS